MATPVQRLERNNTEKANYDYILLIVVVTLLTLGLMMVYSTTFSLNPDEPTFYFVRQLQWSAIGLALLVILARIPYRFWRRVSVYLLVGVLVLLVAVLFVGTTRFGAQRTFWNGSLQPSELAKLAIVIYIADWVSSKGSKIRHITYGLVPFAVLLGVLTGLILLQPDFGTSILIVSTASVMFFLAGADILQLVIGGAFGGLSLLFLVTKWPYAAERLVVFWQGLNDPVTGSHYQIRQALVALGQGGVLGRGLGESQLKFTFLPLSHTDSIFAVIGEELGLIGCLVVIGLFALLAYRGLRIALQSPDNFGMILAAGVTTWLVLESLINIAVVTATLPPTGIPLPFISYGGSALVSAMAGVGILLSISRGVREEGDTYADSHSRRGDSRPRLPKHSRRAGDDRHGEFGIQQTR